MATAATLLGNGVPPSVMWKRVASAVVGIPVVVWLTLAAPAPVFHAVVVAAAVACGWELSRMFQRAGRATHPWLDPVLAGAVAASFVLPGGPVVALGLAVMLTLVVSLAHGVGPSMDAVTTTLLVLGYVGWLLGHAVLLRGEPDGGALVLLLLGATWAGETAAYAVGSLLGRRKLAPVVSPNKTVEGGIAQLAATVLATVVLRPWLAPGWSPTLAVVAGIVLGVTGQLGDLSESVIKRSLGTKDTGGLIPGHGGVLDRLDGVLFNVPVLYYVVEASAWWSGGGRA